MLLKVVRSDPHALESATILEVGPDVTYGTFHFDEEPEGGRAYFDRLDCPDCVVLRVFDAATDPGPTGQYPMRWARWRGPDGYELAVTSGQMYLLTNEGETIERLR